MSNASDYLEQQIFNHLLRNDTFAKPTNVAIGLTINVDQTDSTYLEVGNGNGYARIPGVSGDSKWNAHGTGGPGDNAVEFSFDQATGDWGMVSGVIITDSPTYSGGNLLLQGQLTTPRDVRSGDTFKFNAGDLDLTIA